MVEGGAGGTEGRTQTSSNGWIHMSRRRHSPRRTTARAKRRQVQAPRALRRGRHSHSVDLACRRRRRSISRLIRHSWTFPLGRTTSSPSLASPSLSTFNVPTVAGTATIDGFGEEDNDGSLSGGEYDADGLMVDIEWGLGSVWGSGTDASISTSTLPVTPSAVLASIVAPQVPAVTLVEFHFAVLARQPWSEHGPKLCVRSRTTLLSASPSLWSTALSTPARGSTLLRCRYRASMDPANGCVRDDDARQAEEGSQSSCYEWEAHRRRRWIPLRPSLRRQLPPRKLPLPTPPQLYDPGGMPSIV
jgi:hypothetical protein